MSRHLIRPGVAAAIACCTAVLTCSVGNSKVGTPIRKALLSPAQKATAQRLGGRDRYLTCVATDKPIYHPGEKVYVRGVLLNASNHRPLTDGDATGSPVIEIKGPKGDTIASSSATVQNSVWSFAWEIPEGQAGGEYSIHATYPWTGHAPAERKFDIREYRAPRLKSQITFLRDGYGPGEKVNATLDVKRAEGDVPEGAKVTVTARVDGIEIKGGTAKVDAKGLCFVSFQLPRQIPRGEGTLALTIEDGGVVETAAKTIPILLQTVDLQTFPEGGDLIAGCSNRVYVQAKQPNGKPADLAAKLMSKQVSGVVTEFRTEHEGRGRFAFTPSAGKAYYLSIAQPAGIKKTYPLPTVKSEGAIVRSDKNVFEKGKPVTVQVACTKKVFRVTLAKREVELAACKIDLSKSSDHPGTLHPISFNVSPDVDGVLTVTVWDKMGIPLAERLIFREPANPLTVSIRPDKKSYIPGENARLTVKTTDAHGKPVPAIVGMTVTDDTVLEMVEKREQAPRLPAMLFLEPEVQDLADAHVYLDPNNPKAPLATDLLLGTQGWRRFALMELDKFIEAHGDQARRAVALKIQTANQLACCKSEAIEEEGAVAKDRQLFAEKPTVLAQMAPPPPLASLKPPMPKESRANADAPGFFANEKKQKIAQARAGINELQDALMRADRRARGKRFLRNDEFSTRGPSNLVYVREFAHQVRANRKPTDRVDFSETLYWNSGVKTDAKTGEATVSFGLNDSVSTFRVFTDAFTSSGAIGAGNQVLASVQPFYAEVKMPLEVTAGDRILLPISLINATDSKLAETSVNVDLKGNFKLQELLKSRTDIGIGDRVRWLQPINVGYSNGLKDFTLTARAGVYEDKVTKKLSVKPKGFPTEISFGGIIQPGKVVTHSIVIPKAVVQGSMLSNTAVYPTPLANLTEALQSMIQEPYGCFEQTSSTSYPLTMAQQYFLSHTGVDAKLVEASRQKLDSGYKRLVSYWCPDRGYEWFGENPGHEALTAFGLLHFTDMSKVREVDQNMVATTRAWLLKQKDGQGGFTRKRRSMHSWIEDKDCSNAYILWALLESGQSPADLKSELDSLKRSATASQNSYVLALAANALHLAGDKAAATKLTDRLSTKQKPDGSVEGVSSSIVGSDGESLEVEGTALATLAWMREPAYAGQVEKSIKFLADSCKAGRYGSTQATVLALRAIVTYDKQRAHPKAPGKVRIFVDGQPIGSSVAFNQSTQGAIKLPDLSELLTPGNHKLELRMEGGAAMPYSLAVKYNALTPASDKECKLDISVAMAQDKLVEGTATEANVTLTNRSRLVVPTPVAIVGLPGGLEPRHDQLKELVKKGKVDAYEVIGREVVLYWRALPSEAKVEIPLSLIAAVPGSYTGPASRAYLYYTDEHKRWVDGVHVEISPK